MLYFTDMTNYEVILYILYIMKSFCYLTMIYRICKKKSIFEEKNWLLKKKKFYFLSLCYQLGYPWVPLKKSAHSVQSFGKL